MLAPPDTLAQIEEGRAAWGRLRERGRREWADWVAIGKALEIAKRQCLQAAGCTTPYGQRYSKAMGAWLAANDMGDIGQQVRCRLARCMERLHDIEKWRASLDEEKRAKFSHPDSIWFNFTDQRRDVKHPTTRRYTAPNHPASRRRIDKMDRPSQDMVRRVATALRQNWTTDTFRLAQIAIDAVAADPDLDALLAPPAPKPSKERPTSFQPAEASA